MGKIFSFRILWIFVNSNSNNTIFWWISFISEIHCLKTDTQARFSSILRLPPGHSAPPVLEEVPAPQQSTGCQISATTLDNVFLVDLDRLDECGVRECEEQGETWLCLLVRYPVLRGLRLPEDEIINIKCKPQDRAVAGQNAINFQEAMWVLKYNHLEHIHRIMLRVIM